MNELAWQKGGKFLSKKYVNNHNKLKFQCIDGHAWWTCPANVKRGKWCPDCSSGLAEKKCRYIFENLFGHDFPKSHLKWKDSHLELDGYSQELNIAFEYNGIQHYEFVKGLSRTKEKFRQLQHRDKEKVKLCKRSKINLITIHYRYANSDKSLVDYIVKQAKKLDIGIQSSVDWSSFYEHSSVFRKIKELVIRCDGKLLAKSYTNNRTPFKVECHKGHEWDISYSSLQNGTWCPYCVGRYRTIKDMHIWAKERKGSCLSSQYVDAHTKLKWKCKRGHEFKMNPNKVHQGRWCQVCNGK